MADQEFQESELIFSDNSHDTHHQEHDDAGSYFDYRTGFSRKEKTNNNKKKEIAARPSTSLPVNIPYHHRGSVYHYSGGDSEEEDDEGEMVPPHVILGRRLGLKMAFSVCTGNGRTLKGRDLSEVRNSVLRMTGFLEA